MLLYLSLGFLGCRYSTHVLIFMTSIFTYISMLYHMARVLFPSLAVFCRGKLGRQAAEEAETVYSCEDKMLGLGHWTAVWYISFILLGVHLGLLGFHGSSMVYGLHQLSLCIRIQLWFNITHIRGTLPQSRLPGTRPVCLEVVPRFVGRLTRDILRLMVCLWKLKTTWLIVVDITDNVDVRRAYYLTFQELRI